MSVVFHVKLLDKYFEIKGVLNLITWTGAWGMDFVSSSPLFSTTPPFFKFSYTVKPRFIVPRFTAKLAYRQEFLQSRFPYAVITPLKCQTRIPPSATVIKDQTVNLLLFKPRS